MKLKNSSILSLLISLSIFYFVAGAQAATLFINPATSQAGIDSKFSVDVRVDSEGGAFNAAQTVIRFPRDILEVVSLDKSDSAFGFWLEEPTFSNTTGIISFTGGTPYGVSGGSIQILKIDFLTKSAGAGTLALSDAAVSASDGSGTNILSKTSDGSFTVFPKKITVTTPSPAKLSRPAIPGTALPVKPDVRVPLYPSPDGWYNDVFPFLVSWHITPDITDVATASNHNPFFVPPKSEGLFESKLFPPPEEGISYLHVRFKNNIGWGPVAHYRVAIDTAPPTPFTIKVEQGTADNPQPKLSFSSSDPISVIDHYEIRDSNLDALKTSENSFTLPPQIPGKHLVKVMALDKAGNGTEESVEIVITPIISPVITSIDETLLESGEGLQVVGTASPLGTILFILKYEDESIKQAGEIKVDEHGMWLLRLDKYFPRGNYFLEITARDSRGALSLPVRSKTLKSNPGSVNIFLILLVIFLLIITLFPWLPAPILKKFPILGFFRNKINQAIAALSGDKYRHYSGGLDSLKKAFASVHDHVVITDPRANVLYANKSALENSGFSLDEVLGKNPGDLWGGRMPEKFYQKMWHTIKIEKKAFVGRVKNKRKDGSYHWQEIRISPILNDKGEVKYFIGIQPEVSDH